MEVIEDVLEVTINGKTYKLDMAEVAERMVIDPADLDGELEQQTSLFFWVSTLAANAAFAVEEEKQAFDVFWADILNDARLSFEKGEGKLPAATIIESKAKQDPEYREKLADLMELKRTAGILEVVKKAVESRQYLLIERSKRLSRDAAAEYHNS